jgi:hypothetical protein
MGRLGHRKGHIEMFATIVVRRGKSVKRAKMNMIVE